MGEIDRYIGGQRETDRESQRERERERERVCDMKDRVGVGETDRYIDSHIKRQVEAPTKSCHQKEKKTG